MVRELSRPRTWRAESFPSQQAEVSLGEVAWHSWLDCIYSTVNFAKFVRYWDQKKRGSVETQTYNGDASLRTWIVIGK